MTTSSQWHDEHERLVVFVDQHRADFIEDDGDDAEESEQKMAIVREWLTAIPEVGNSATHRDDGKGKGDRRRPPTAAYAKTRDAGKANSALVRLSSSKRRTSASSQLQNNRRQPLRSLASLVRRGGRMRQVVVEQTGGQQVQQKQQKQEEQQQPQPEQQQQQMYNQAARPMNSSAPRWLAAVQSTKKSNNKSKQGNRPRSRSVEVASSTPASGGSPGGSSPRHRVAQWGSSSNLLATQSSGGSASLETLRAGSRTSAAQVSPRYQRVTAAKPLQPRQQDVRKPELTNREINSAARDHKVTTIKRRVVAQVPQQSENEIELAQEPPNEPTEPTQESVWQQIDFSMLHQIGQRRSKTAFETPAGTDEVNVTSTNISSPRPAKPTVKATKPQARRAAAATARFDTAPIQTAGSSPTASTYYSSERRQLFQTASTQAEPETAVGYFIERERASTARQSRSRATGQKATGNNSSSSRGEDQRQLNPSEQLGSVGKENSSLFSTENQQHHYQASTARSHQVFQLQPTPSHRSLHSGVAGNGVTNNRSAAEKKPVSYGYNWLQEFNKMSITEAEIERRVKNGGKLRNSASQTTRFELPFDLRELEEMDPKDYLRQYTVVSSRRMYLYQKVFQKYRNSSLNAVEVKDLSKCISDIIVGGISEEKLEEMLHLTSMLDAGQLDSKLFYAFCAVVERQTTGKSLPDDPSELMECHKQRLESADFIGLNYKLKGVNLSEEMDRLLKAL